MPDYLAFGIVMTGATVGEALVYKYMVSEGRFKVTKEEKRQMKSDVQKILEMKTTKEKIRGVREIIIPSIKDPSVKNLMEFVYSSMEEEYSKTPQYFLPATL